MKRKWVVFLVLALIPLVGCNGDLPLLGLDQNGNVVEQWVDHEGFSRFMGETMTSVQDSTLPVLAEQPESTGWEVRTAVVGLVLSGSVGLGPYSVGGLARFRLAFSNSTDPALP